MWSSMYYPAWDILLHRVTCSLSVYVFWLTHQAIAWRRGVLKILIQENSLTLAGSNWEVVFLSLHLPRRARRKKIRSIIWMLVAMTTSPGYGQLCQSRESQLHILESCHRMKLTPHSHPHSIIRIPKSSRSEFPSSPRETPLKDSVEERDSWRIVATRIQCPSALIKHVKLWTHCRAQGNSSHAQYFIWGKLPIFSGEMTVFLPPCEPWSLRGHFTFDSSFSEKILSQILNKCSFLFFFFFSEYWVKRQGWTTFSASLPKDLTCLVVFLRT